MFAEVDGRLWWKILWPIWYLFSTSTLCERMCVILHIIICHLYSHFTQIGKSCSKQSKQKTMQTLRKCLYWHTQKGNYNYSFNSIFLFLFCPKISFLFKQKCFENARAADKCRVSTSQPDMKLVEGRRQRYANSVLRIITLRFKYL